MNKAGNAFAKDAEQISFNIIGKVSSPYKEKFAIPRQPGLVSCAKGKVTLIAQANNIDLVRGLEQFSHIWLLFIFHATEQQGWKPLVRPPRLGGNKKIPIFEKVSPAQLCHRRMRCSSQRGVRVPPRSFQRARTSLQLGVSQLQIYLPTEKKNEPVYACEKSHWQWEVHNREAVGPAVRQQTHFVPGLQPLTCVWGQSESERNGVLRIFGPQVELRKLPRNGQTAMEA